MSKSIERLLSRLAIRDALPQATKARLLLEQALEWEEDASWNALASLRERQSSRFVSHQTAWR